MYGYNEREDIWDEERFATKESIPDAVAWDLPDLKFRFLEAFEFNQ